MFRALMAAMLLGALLLLAGAPPAQAVEQRLRVANLAEQAINSFFDGPIRTGSGELVLARLEQALDTGRVGSGAFVNGRVVQVSREAVAQSFGAVKTLGAVTPAEGRVKWDEVVWDAKPGERSLWVMAPTSTHIQQVRHVALRGAGPGAQLRYFIPYRASVRMSGPLPVVGYPLGFLRFHEDRGTELWDRYLSKSVSLADGIAAVIGINDNHSFADWVYLIVEHQPRPTTFEVVVGWERRWAADPNFIGRDP